MKLIEIFNHLTYGELSQLNLGANTGGEPKDVNIPMLLSHINLGLNALYRRFNLRTEYIEFTLVADAETYSLEQEDLYKIEEVYTSSDVSLPINDGALPYSCFTPQAGTLRVPLDIVNKADDLPEGYTTDTLRVVFKAKHPTITEDADPESYEVSLPYSHLNALIYFVAARAHTPFGLSNNFHLGNDWSTKYEMECARLEQEGMAPDIDKSSNRLKQNGWV